MNSLEKALTALERLAEVDLLLPASERIEIKRTRSGHWRLYVACSSNQSTEVVPAIRELLDSLDVTVNSFEKAGRLVSLQVVDNNED